MSTNEMSVTHVLEDRTNLGRGLLSKVVEHIGLRVVNGTFAPGTILPIEPVLMSELRVSRTVLREAIKILAGKGIVESRTRVGTRVLPRARWNLLDPMILAFCCKTTDYAELARAFQQVRVIIEPEAAALAAFARTRIQLAAIERAYDDMGSAAEASGWIDADLRFHEAILEATGNAFLSPLGALISAALESLISHSFQTSPNPFKSLPAHKRVLDAIRARDADRARKTMHLLLANTALSISTTARRRRGTP